MKPVTDEVCALAAVVEAVILERVADLQEGGVSSLAALSGGVLFALSSLILVKIPRDSQGRAIDHELRRIVDLHIMALRHHAESHKNDKVYVNNWLKHRAKGAGDEKTEGEAGKGATP